MTEDQERNEEEIPEIEAGKAAADAYRQWRNTTEVQNLSVLVATVADAVLRRVRPMVIDRERGRIVATLTALAEQHEANGDVFENEFAAGIREAIEKIDVPAPAALSGGTPEPTDG